MEMEMESMIERVAKAIYEKRNGSGCTPWGRQKKVHQAPYLDDAAAAIEAMRTPTEAMSRVLGDAAKYGTRSNGEVGPKDLMSEVIDAALKDVTDA